MNKIREIIRLNDPGLSQRQISVAVGAPLGTVNCFVSPYRYIFQHSFGIIFLEIFSTNFKIKWALPAIKNKNMTIILDNASFHKRSDIKKLVQESGNNLKYLPPHSPDFNPVEKKWSQIKRNLDF
ncbi:MAG: hypothetical protein ACI9IL_000551 [Rickettsiales bacterium]|jgi:hypothetical protein